jgi:large subunit ribosomal protein L16
MLQPARRKYRKEQKGRNRGLATRGANVSFGEFGLKATERGRLTARQIEAARRAITPPHQARRPHLDPHLPGQADLAEAGRGPHGQRQGQPRVLRGRDPARQGALRDGRRDRALAREAFALAAAKLPLRPPSSRASSACELRRLA